MKGKEYIKIMEDESSEPLPPKTLVHLALKYKNNFEKRDEMRTVLFRYLKKRKHSYIFEKMTEDEINSCIAEYYNQDQKGKYDFFYSGLPERELWRLFVDLKKQRDPKEKGWVGYEAREKGCIQAMYNAFQFVNSTIEVELSPSYIAKIHRLAAEKCSPLTSYAYEGAGWSATVREVKIPILPGEYRGTVYGTITAGKSTVTPLGMIKLIKSSEEVTYTNNKQHLLIFPKYLKNSHEYEHVIEQSIKCYEQEVENKCPMDKLKAIVKLVQSIERIHAFRDGNLRTCILLLNRELVRHGFTPTLLEDPNRFDGFTKNELLYEVLRGMRNFSILKSEGAFPDCENTMDILLKEKHPLEI